MNFTELSTGERGWIIALTIIVFMIITILMCVGFIYRRTFRNAKKLSSINLYTLEELNKMPDPRFYVDFTPALLWIDSIPSYAQYILFALSVAFATYEFSFMYRCAKRGVINIKGAIENLPTGLAFYNQTGILSLSNRIMHTLSYKLTGKDLQNGLELQNDLKTLQGDVCCVMSGEEPAYLIEDAGVWRFSRSCVKIDSVEYVMLKADDITDAYRLADNIQTANARLLREHEWLCEHMKNIEQLISDEETLRIKMALHNDFGELIALTVRAICSDEKEEIIKKWEELTHKMTAPAIFGKKGEYSIENIEAFAQKLGCDLEMFGKAPQDPQVHAIFTVAIFETIKNAFYHAKPGKITVTTTHNDDKIIVIINSDNTKKLTDIVEGGGLGAIRKRVESVGGEMTLTCEQSISLKIIF